MIKIVIILAFVIVGFAGDVLAATISSITYSTDRGATGSADTISPPNWTINVVPLLPGNNNITVTVTNSDGQTATDTQLIIYTPTFPGNAMVGAWAFKDGSGTSAVDSSGNTNTGTLVNGPTWTTQGKFDNAITFDGVNDYVNVPDANNLDFTQSFTIAAWVKPTNVSGWRTIVAKSQNIYAGEWPVQFLYASNVSGSGCSSGGRVQGGFIANGISGPVNNICSTAPLPTGQNSHVALTYDHNEGNLRLYINGVLNNTVAATGIMEPSALAWKTGNDDYANAFAGDIDEVRLYNFALPLTAGSNTVPGAECTTTNRTDQNAFATASVIGAMNCSILAGVPPLAFKLPASSTGLKIGADGLKVGQVP